jgi:signal transduction histidine kinase
MRKPFTCLYVLLFTACLYAQPGEIRMSALTTQDGLESNYNYHLYRDSKGFLWISSIDGIFRADGLNIKAYNAKNGMLGSIVQSNFHEDAEGNLWFSTYNGINKYGRSGDYIEAFQIPKNGQDTVREDYYLIHLEQNKNLWFRAGAWLCQYDLQNRQATTLSTTAGVRFGIDTTKNGKLTRIYACPWMNAQGVEIFTIGENGSLNKNKFLTPKETGKQHTIMDLLVENDTLVWLFSNQGMVAFNPAQPTKIETYSLPKPGKSAPFNAIFYNLYYMLVLDRNGEPFFFDRAKRAFLQAESVPLVIPLKEKKHREMLLDREGILWFAHEENPLIEFGSLFQPLFTTPTFNLIKNDLEVASIFENHDQGICYATANDGLYMISREGIVLEHIPYLTGKGKVFKPRYAPVQDEQRQVWATSGKSLFLLKGGKPNWEEIKINEATILRIGFAGPSGKFLATSSGLQQLLFQNGSYQSAPGNFFTSDESFDGILTFFGKSGIIYSYIEGKVRIKKTNQPEFAAILPDVSPNTMWENETAQITWFGTTAGLFYWHWDSTQIQQVRHPDLDRLMITAVTGDAQGRLWLGSYNGIYLFQPETGSCYQFTEADGLPSNTISMSAALTTSANKIWFGTNKGPVHFDPEKVKPYPHAPAVHIESLEINNEPYRGIPVPSEAARIELAHHQNNLAFRLKAVGFYLPKLSVIHYRLRGLDDDWATLENGGLLRYPKLPPGEYHLELYGENANGVAGKTRSLTLLIRPPWWQRWWFKVLIISALAGIGYLAFRYYLQRKLLEQQRLFERQKALQEERNRIASELHDDLGSGLSIIRFLSDHTLHQQQPASDESRQNIRRIYQSAGELLEKMSDIIWAMNAENDTLANLAGYLQGYAYEYLDVNQLRCEFLLPENLPTVELSGAQRRNILLAVKESLHNTVKHAHATVVLIELAIAPGLVIFTIKDDGRGFDLYHPRAGGNGLRNLKKRMEGIGGSADIFVENGTTVRLTLPVGV